MMETKLWAALCALLLVNLGSADHVGDHTDPSSGPKSTEASSADSVPVSSLNISQAVTTPSTNGSDTTPGSSVTSSLINSTSTEEQQSISLTPEPKKANDTDIVPPPKADNSTDHSTTQPPIPASASHTPTSHIPVTAVAINATHPAHAAPVDTTQSTSTLSTNTTSHVEPTLPHSTNQTIHPKTHSSTSVPAPEPATTTTTTTISQDNSTSSSSSSHETLSSVLPTLTSPQKTSLPDGHAETSSTARQTPTTTPLPKIHDNPSPLNVGGDTTMVHESPKLDPLLAGLVSAFIITAVIITLLLFLKLRRRDNRPEFRRLQDLPMDDMEEDTPLSMYSY